MFRALRATSLLRRRGGGGGGGEEAVLRCFAVCVLLSTMDPRAWVKDVGKINCFILLL